jgi:hypothetical protein
MIFRTFLITLFFLNFVQGQTVNSLFVGNWQLHNQGNNYSEMHFTDNQVYFIDEITATKSFYYNYYVKKDTLYLTFNKTEIYHLKYYFRDNTMTLIKDETTSEYKKIEEPIVTFYDFNCSLKITYDEFITSFYDGFYQRIDTYRNTYPKVKSNNTRIETPESIAVFDEFENQIKNNQNVFIKEINRIKIKDGIKKIKKPRIIEVIDSANQNTKIIKIEYDAYTYNYTFFDGNVVDDFVVIDCSFEPRPCKDLCTFQSQLVLESQNFEIKPYDIKFKILKRL